MVRPRTAGVEVEGLNPQVPPTDKEGLPGKRKSGAQRRREKKLRESAELNIQGGKAPAADSTSPKSRKRGRLVGSTPPELRQAQKRANRRPEEHASEKKVVVAITSRDYPTTLLEDSQVRALDEEVMLRVGRQGQGYVPQFEGRRLGDGALHVTCRSEADKQCRAPKALGRG